MRLPRVGHDWATSLSLSLCQHGLGKVQSVFSSCPLPVRHHRHTEGSKGTVCPSGCCCRKHHTFTTPSSQQKLGRWSLNVLTFPNTLKWNLNFSALSISHSRHWWHGIVFFTSRSLLDNTVSTCRTHLNIPPSLTQGWRNQSGSNEQGLLSSCRALASRGSFSCCGAQALGMRASAVVTHRLSCLTTCRITPNQGSDPCPLHWQADT